MKWTEFGIARRYAQLLAQSSLTLPEQCEMANLEYHVKAYEKQDEKGKLEAQAPSWAEAAISARHAAKPSRYRVLSGGEA